MDVIEMLNNIKQKLNNSIKEVDDILDYLAESDDDVSDSSDESDPDDTSLCNSPIPRCSEPFPSNFDTISLDNDDDAPHEPVIERIPGIYVKDTC